MSNPHFLACDSTALSLDMTRRDTAITFRGTVDLAQTFDVAESTCDRFEGTAPKRYLTGLRGAYQRQCARDGRRQMCGDVADYRCGGGACVAGTAGASFPTIGTPVGVVAPRVRRVLRGIRGPGNRGLIGKVSFTS